MLQIIANQLQGGNMVIDYDQILAKRPASSDAVFAWWVTCVDHNASAFCSYNV